VLKQSQCSEVTALRDAVYLVAAEKGRFAEVKYGLKHNIRSPTNSVRNSLCNHTITVSCWDITVGCYIMFLPNSLLFRQSRSALQKGGL